ncbi:MAG: 2-hydroxyacyl-CoA dehydratase [Thermodesulfobacteriota bacterium]
MAAYYDDVLMMCGFEGHELEGDRPRIERALEKLQLGSEQMDVAEERLRRFFEIDLRGVRRLLRVWLQETFEVVLAREEGKGVVYFGYPPIQATGMAIKEASKGGLYVGCPEMVLCHSLGQIFDRLTPLLEAAEQGGLPPGHAMCALLQIKLGALAKGIIPVPDLAVATSYYCDMGPKADELMEKLYGHRTIYIDSCMDSPWGEWPSFHPERVAYLGSQIDKFFEEVRGLFGVRVDDTAWARAKATGRHLYESSNRLNQLMMADPMPLSGADVELALQFATACTGSAMTEGPGAIDLLCGEVEEKIRGGKGVVEKGAPRVLIFNQHYSDPAVTKMMEEAGLAVSATLATIPPRRPTKPGDYITIGEKRAEQAMWSGIYHSTYGWAKRFEDVAKALGVDGVIYNYQYSCRPLALSSDLVKQFLEQNTGIPTLALEMDYYDSRNYSAAALRTRVEAFAEMLRARKKEDPGLRGDRRRS